MVAWIRSETKIYVDNCSGVQSSITMAEDELFTNVGRVTEVVVEVFNFFADSCCSVSPTSTINSLSNRLIRS